MLRRERVCMVEGVLVEQLLEDGEGESKGFPAACFCECDDISALEGVGESGLLDAGGGGEVETLAG